MQRTGLDVTLGEGGPSNRAPSMNVQRPGLPAVTHLFYGQIIPRSEPNHPPPPHDHNSLHDQDLLNAGFLVPK